MLQAFELEAQVGLPASARHCRRKSELKQYQHPEKLSFFIFLYGSQEAPSVMKKASDRSGA